MTNEIPAPVRDWVKDAVSVLRLSEDDPLILTGSAVLPFDTSSSDIDLMVITSATERYAHLETQRNPERLSEQIANEYAICYFDHAGMEVDLEAWPMSRVERAISELPTKIASPDEIETDFTRVGGLEVKVGTDLIHTLMLGIAIHGAARFEELRASVPWRCYLAWKRDSLLINVRDATKGIPASLRSGRPDEAFMKLCWAADSAVDALIFHSGMSINRWKWRLRYLPYIDQEIASWYREVRFGEPALEAASLELHQAMLREIWQTYASTEPQPASLPIPATK